LNQRFPWVWDPDIRNIELEIDRRLRTKGLYPTPRVFCPYTSTTYTRGLCPDTNHPHKLIASRRAEAAINTWAPYLFPLVHEAEVRLQGIRNMPNYRSGHSRCNYFGITGIVDVITSVNLLNANPGNLILHYIQGNNAIQDIINNLSTDEYEIIIDYKGMRRPPIQSDLWQYHEWQVHTYAWLRSQQIQSNVVVAGIVFYLNELVFSNSDIIELKADIISHSTDIMPQGLDLQRIQNWARGSTIPRLTGPLKEARSIRIIPCNTANINNSLQQFEHVVNDIENCVLTEMQGRDIPSVWRPIPNQRNCTVCDFKTFCSNPAPGPYNPTVP